MIELLAPAGSNEQLTAAVRCGADAVYMGAKNFNARRNADNFSELDFEESVKYCHERNVKVYTTVNTLVKDSEIEELKNTLKEIARCGVDGVLVQDLVVYSIICDCVPAMPLHASTQMAVHNVSGAKQLERMGFSRIVLARELSFEEIKSICNSVSCEVEVFVHGAHCMSASGMCYMSSALGTRSGNRGLCAQPCRLDFKKDERHFALSLKDMCLIDETSKLIDAGVSSLKIEGRMKRPEYVGAVVTEYRKAIDGKAYDRNLLKNVFSRNGFTKGYFEAKRNLEMFGYRTKDDVENMTSVLSGLKNLYKDDISKIKADFTFTAKKDIKSVLTVTDGINTVKTEGSVPETAINKPLTQESAIKSISKTGGSYFYPGNISTDIDERIMLPASSINAMRRDALSELSELRRELHSYSFTDNSPLPEERKPAGQGYFCFFRKREQAFCDKGSTAVLPVNEITEETAGLFKGNLTAALPPLIYPARESYFTDELLRIKKLGIEYCFAENIGAVKIIKDAGLKCLGGGRLNVINSFACKEYANEGIVKIILSHEISFSDIKKIRSPIPFGITVYGYMPLMHFRCCPMQSKNGCGSCDGKQKLTDRIGKQFTVLCENRQFSVLHNCVPLYAEPSAVPDADFYSFFFTTESKEECEQIVRCFKEGKSISGPKTLGLYNKSLI